MVEWVLHHHVRCLVDAVISHYVLVLLHEILLCAGYCIMRTSCTIHSDSRIIRITPAVRTLLAALCIVIIPSG